MVLKSYAKINLTLSIDKKLPNGFHNLQSIFCLVDLFDKITIKKLYKKKKDEITFIGPQSKLVKKSDNSVQSVLNLMRKEKYISNYYSVKVFKNIPVFAGFGGGTSNAVTIFNFLKKKIKKQIKLDRIINKIGTDFRLFLSSQGFLKNLKTVIDFRKKHKLYFLLVYPKIKCSTKKIYSLLDKFSLKREFPKNKITYKDCFINYLLNSNNDLQSIVEKKHPVIKKLIANIGAEKGCYFSRMSGSGSGCYGLFTSENCSKVALKKLRKKYPKFWFSIAKTI